MKAITLKVAPLAMALLLVMSVSAFAELIETGANVGAGDETLGPIVKAKWETVPSANPDLDNDPTKPWTQVTSPMVYQGTKDITYWLIATGPFGKESLDTKAYVDVFHPNYTCVYDPKNEAFKYQVTLNEQTFQCNVEPQDPTLTRLINQLQNAYDAGLVTFGKAPNGSSYTLDEVVHELIKCDAKIYIGTKEIDYHQPCGEFDWASECVGTPPYCEYEWTATNMKMGYRVDAYVFDKTGVKSDILTNYFEYICEAGIELDFTSLDFGHVMMSINKWIVGDNFFNEEKGPACAGDVSTEGCHAPTIRNIGNTPSYLWVEFNDMGFGQSTSGWNVLWDARLGERNDIVFNPFEETKLPGDPLWLCNTDQISFSMHVIKPEQTGELTGNVTIEPDALFNDESQCGWYEQYSD